MIVMTTRQPVPVPPRCVHLGQPTGETVRCAACRGAALKVFACGQFGRCTLGRPGEGVAAVCELRGVRCEKFEAAATGGG